MKNGMIHLVQAYEVSCAVCGKTKTSVGGIENMMMGLYDSQWQRHGAKWVCSSACDGALTGAAKKALK